MSVAATKPFFELAAALPDHLCLGAELAQGLSSLPPASGIDNIAILGMGTGHTAGCVLSAAAASTLPVPILVQSTYELPACLGKRSLVFAVSGSGDTDEVNHSASDSAARGARMVVVTTGGWLANFSRETGSALIAIPQEIKPARVTFGVIVGALLASVGRIGFLPEAEIWLEGAGVQLRCRRDELVQGGNIAARLAAELKGKHVACQGDAPIGAPAAERWKAQINQNAKHPASASAQPNASHNEAVAWDSADSRRNEAAVLLRHPFEDRRVGQRMDLLAGYLKDKIPVHDVRGKGVTPFAALMDLTMVGDFVSLHLAELNGSDPGADTFIAKTLKAGLKPPGAAKG
jgi:glucose/mannose-6-phosphate isomerase